MDLYATLTLITLELILLIAGRKIPLLHLFAALLSSIFLFTSLEMGSAQAPCNPTPYYACPATIQTSIPLYPFALIGAAALILFYREMRK